VDSNRNQALLLILASTVLILIVYLTIPFTPQRKRPEGPTPTPQVQKSWFKVPGFLQPEIKVLVAGDVMLGRTVMGRSLDSGDPKYPFLKVAERLWKADLTFVNLENPIVTNCPRQTTSLVFCADPQMLEGLTYSGVDVVTLGNNHSRNYGQKGLDETQMFLNEKGIAATGLGSLVTKKVAGTTFGFLGFNFVDINPKSSDYDLVADSDKKVDVLVVGVHWGAEYQATANLRQRKIAAELVKAGADVVVGHHPHWVQDMEYLDGKPVYYSLGNFIFDQMWSEKTKEGLVVELTFKDKKLVGEKKLPIYMREWAQPQWVE